MTTSTWFITGSTRGFGRALTIAALESGDQVVATARTPEQLADLVTRWGDRILPVALDVTYYGAATRAVHAAVDQFGQIDVVVNNAGYANIAPVETAEEADFRQQFETNFWGVYNISKAVLPVLKAQGAGTIVQFSSMGGRIGGTPGLGSYQAAKFAVDGLTRVLVAETGPLGVTYLVVEPGGFDTDWAGASMEIQGIPSEYDSTVGESARMMGGELTSAGDPRRAAEILVRVVKRDTVPSHLLLGAYAATAGIQYSNSQIVEAADWQQVSASADFNQAYPVEFPADRPAA
jgi:NAD(P)-dependent dehydrogenase (short-subunit alcohol dehydrogenase family)